MTPGINLVKKAKIVHQVNEYGHDAASESYGLEAAEKMGVDAVRVFKTLVVSLDNKTLAVGVVPVCAKLSMKSIAKALGAKKAVMAERYDGGAFNRLCIGRCESIGAKKASQDRDRQICPRVRQYLCQRRA